METTKNSHSANKNDEARPVVKNASDLQRLKIEKLMKNPEKEVIIPEGPKDKKLPPPPDFIRNVMGSSAGAGSGEFHVYRHLRRKEYSRQKFIQEQKERTRLDEEYNKKIDANQKAIEERTEKKRQKRLKKKAKYKEAKKKRKLNEKSNNSAGGENSVSGEEDSDSQEKGSDEGDDTRKKENSDSEN